MALTTYLNDEDDHPERLLGDLVADSYDVETEGATSDDIAGSEQRIRLEIRDL